MQEYYIRNPDSEESRGPFSVEQLASLGETGHVSLETYVYNTEEEQWEVLESNEELRAAVFPEKKRLTMKPKGEFESLNKGEAELPAVTVDELLAAAEGNTEETRHKKKVNIWREKAAVLAMYIAGAAFVLSAVGLFLVQRGLFADFEASVVFTNPMILVGLLDLGIALILFLQTTAVYPLIRFRTMLGAGFALFFFWAVEQPLVGVVAALGWLGIYGLTLFLDKIPFLTTTALAIFGMIGFIVLALGV